MIFAFQKYFKMMISSIAHRHTLAMNPNVDQTIQIQIQMRIQIHNSQVEK